MLEGKRVWVLCRKFYHHPLTGTVQVRDGENVFIKLDPPTDQTIVMPSEASKGLLWDYIDDPWQQMNANVEMNIDKEMMNIG